MRLVLTALLACSAPTTPAGPVGPPADLRDALPEGISRGIPAEPTTHKKALPIGPGGAGEAELVWGTAEVGGGAWVTDVSLVVTRPADGVEVLPLQVLAPHNRGTAENPLATVNVVVTWRKSTACASETRSVGSQVDGKGNWTEL